MKNSSTNTAFNLFRITPIILEGLPVLVILIGVIIPSDFLILIGLMSLSFVYLVLPWYLFKSLKFNAVDIIMSLFLGQALSVACIALLFSVLKWESYEVMALTGITSLIAGSAISLVFLAIKYFVSKSKRKFEYRMSYKLLSRFLIFIIIYLALGLDQHFTKLFDVN
jgi:hypothetical protein